MIKKPLGVLAGVVLGLCAASLADVVTFEDPNVESEVRFRLGIEAPMPITELDMEGLDSLIFSSDDVTSLSGLETASNLWLLHAWGNNISDLSPIAGLGSLLSVEITSSGIQMLPENLAWVEIHEISFSGNSINDIRPLAALTTLYNLNLNNNEVSDLSPLGGISFWGYLQLEGNQISDVSPLGSSSVSHLLLADNQISDISTLSEIRVFTELDLRGNPLNQDAYDIYLPMIEANNPDAIIRYDIPEPSVLLLMGAGSLGLLRRRRKYSVPVSQPKRTIPRCREISRSGLLILLAAMVLMPLSRANALEDWEWLGRDESFFTDNWKYNGNWGRPGTGDWARVNNGGTVLLHENGTALTAYMRIGEKNYAGAIDQTTATFNVGTLQVGAAENSFGLYSLSGTGILSVSNAINVSTTGYFYQSGGTVSAAAANLTVYGEYYLSGGNLSANTVKLGPDSGLFQWTGGILDTYSITVNKDSLMQVGYPVVWEYGGNLTINGGQISAGYSLLLGDTETSTGTCKFLGGTSYAPASLSSFNFWANTYALAVGSTTQRSDANIKINGPWACFGLDSSFAVTTPSGQSASTCTMTMTYPWAWFLLWTDDPTALSGLGSLKLVFNGWDEDGGHKTLEAAGVDEGVTGDFTTSNFVLGQLVVGCSSGGTATLLVADDIANLGQAAEAVYVKRLVINAGAAFDLSYANIYYLRANNDTVDNARKLIIGDADLDGDVDWDDYDIWLANNGGTGKSWTTGDFTGDRNVDSEDLQLLLQNLTSRQGDFNGDNLVDLADYTVWADHFGGVDTEVFAAGSSNEDGEVDIADYTIWADNFGKGQDPTPPETLQMMMSMESGPTLAYTSQDLGGGLTGYTFYIDNEDELSLSYGVTLSFQGVSGSSIEQIQAFGAVTVNAEDDATTYDGIPAASYTKAEDTWAYSAFASNPIPGEHPLDSTTFSGFDEDTDEYSFSLGTGSNSQYGDDCDVAYVVSDGEVQWTGVIARNGVMYEVSGSTAE